MTINKNGTIGQAVIKYTGADNIHRLDLVPDEHVAGTYALQVIFEDATIVQFLLTALTSLNRVSASDLEEVEYTCWPPTTADRPTTWRVQ